jgi:excisionase family DNA binding protein
MTPELDRMPALLTIAETCDVLRVSRMTLYRLRDRGELEFVHVSERSPRVPLAAVVRLMRRDTPPVVAADRRPTV